MNNELDTNKEFFVKVYNKYTDEIYRFIYFKIKNKDDALDVLSTVFLKFWNHVHKNKIKKDLKLVRYLIYKIARNCIIDLYRKEGKISKVNIDDENIEIDIPDTSQDIEKDVELSFELVEIEKSLDKLNDKYREILLLKYVNELSIDEISKIVGKSKVNTRVTIHRALKVLKTLVDN